MVENRVFWGKALIIFGFSRIFHTSERCSKVLSLENLNKSRFIWYFARLFVPLHPVMQIMMHWDISHL